ncbi:MAG: site-specific DNA-methyltransferase [Bacillota bacterium]
MNRGDVPPPSRPVRRRPTRTSAFGVSGRISHDSTPFYNSRLYRSLATPAAGPGGAGRAAASPGQENPVPAEVIDRVFCADSRRMAELPDASIHLMVTSPPYNVGKTYDADLSLDEYQALLRDVFAETFRVLVPGGRACVNVANVGRRPYIPFHHYVIEAMLGVGFIMRGEIIWNKAAASGSSTAWGSWCSATNPTLRDVHEYILVFSKGSLARPANGRRSTISRDEFLELTKSVWTFPTESARRVGHPAPFPVELPRRLIQLYTFAGDVVLDPFAGSGTTCVAALQTGRHFVAYDIDPAYVALARRRIEAART